MRERKKDINKVRDGPTERERERELKREKPSCPSKC